MLQNQNEISVMLFTAISVIGVVNEENERRDQRRETDCRPFFFMLSSCLLAGA